MPYVRQPGKTTQPNFVLQRNSDFCATYGAGFVRLQGTDTCVKIGGHVRVDNTITPQSQLEWGSGNFGAPPDDGGAIRSHLRIDDDGARFR